MYDTHGIPTNFNIIMMLEVKSSNLGLKLENTRALLL